MAAYILKTCKHNSKCLWLFSKHNYSQKTPIVSVKEARRFMIDCMIAVGSDKKHSEIFSDHLVTADYRGYYTHGMIRLEKYLKDIVDGLCDPLALPEIIKQTPAVAWVDGKNGLGAVIGKICMEIAIEKAKNIGVGFVAVKGSNHYGICSIYTLQALEQGLLGFSCTNSSPLVTPTRAKEAALGTNPLSLGAPALGDDYFLLDVTTSAVAFGKIEMQMKKNEEIPIGWALDAKGESTTNPADAFKGKRLMPLGGSEYNSGYKGFGLAMLVEILCGILADGSFGPNIRQWGQSKNAANLGHCFIAIDPEYFAPCFKERLSEFMDHLRCMEPIDKSKPVLVPGDMEREHMETVDNDGGLKYVENIWKSCEKLSKEFKVAPIKSINGV